MAYETILYDQDGPILTVNLNRPEKMNAYTGVMARNWPTPSIAPTRMTRCAW